MTDITTPRQAIEEAANWIGDYGDGSSIHELMAGLRANLLPRCAEPALAAAAKAIWDTIPDMTGDGRISDEDAMEYAREAARAATHAYLAALPKPEPAGEMARLRKALHAAKWLVDNINEFGACTDSEGYDGACNAIDAALQGGPDDDR